MGDDLSESYIEWLKEHNKEIRADAGAGDKLAKSIISTYTLYWNRPEPCAAAILESIIDEYRSRQ